MLQNRQKQVKRTIRYKGQATYHLPVILTLLP